MAYDNSNLLSAENSGFESASHNWIGTNATLALNSTSWLIGAASLRLTASAAGTMSATSPRTAVSAGSQYTAGTGVNPRVSGRTGVIEITWYDALTGGASLGTVSHTENWTSTGWRQFCAFGTAPAGALSASFKVSISSVAASEIAYIDEAYFGLTDMWPGNLLGYGAQSFEQSVNGWSVANGAAPSRFYGIIMSGSGYHVLNTSATAAGSVELSTTTGFAVTPGEEYISYAYLFPTTSLTTHVEHRYYDAASALILTEQRIFSTPANTATRLTVGSDAPAGAATMKLFVCPQATAAGQGIYMDKVSLAVAPNRAGNLLDYDAFSFEDSTRIPPLTVNDATYAHHFMMGVDGYYGLKFTPTAEAILTATVDVLIPVTPGDTYQARHSAFREYEGAESITWARRTRIDWYAADGTLFQVDNPDQFYVNTGTGNMTGGWNSTTRTCPEGAAFAKLSIEFDHTYSMPTGYFVDGVSFTEATPEYTLKTDDDAGCIVLTTYYDPASDGLDTPTVTIQRMDADGGASPVRGYGGEITRATYPGGPIVVEDYEVPIGTRVWYRAIWYDPSGVDTVRVLTRMANAPVLSDPDYVWFKSPGIPALNTRVMMEAPVKWSRASRSTRYDIVGRKNPVHVTGVRGGRTSSLPILVWDRDSNDLFDSLLDSGLPVLIQAMPGFGLDTNTYLAVGEAEVEPLSPDARDEGWRWTLEVTEINRPAGGLQGSALSTWQTILDEYATWETLFDAHTTWADVLTKG